MFLMDGESMQLGYQYCEMMTHIASIAMSIIVTSHIFRNVTK